MKNNLFMDFSIDRENKKIKVKREFAAPLEKVWAAWTQAELLDQWWAPKPYVNKTKSMDFSVGGFWLYSMTGPEGDVHWCRADYKSIDALKNYTAEDAFCDENGSVNNDWSRSLWNNSFSEKGDATMVDIVISYDKLEDLEKIIATGFKEGFTMGMENLDALLGK